MHLRFESLKPDFFHFFIHSPDVAHELVHFTSFSLSDVLDLDDLSSGGHSTLLTMLFGP